MKNKLSSFFQSKKQYPVFIILTYLATFFTLSQPIINSYKDGEIVLGSVYLMFFIFIIVIGIIIKPTKPHLETFKAKIFPVSSDAITQKNVWPRPTDTSKIIEELKNTENKPIILVGSSGTGKSMLLDNLVLPRLRSEGWDTLRFDNYIDFQASLLEQFKNIYPNISQDALFDKSELLDVDNDKRILVIYDQFEQFLNTYNDDKEENIEIRKWFRAFIKSLSENDAIRQIIVVRKEYYYDLRFLDEFIPPPIKTVHLSGINIDKCKVTKKILEKRMRQVTKAHNDSETVAKIFEDLSKNGEILPVEVQIVGHMLEKEDKTISIKYYFEKLGAKNDIIKSYFRYYLDSSPDRQISLQVLFALSIQTKLRNQIYAGAIARIVHKPEKDVKKCLKYFTERGLVRTTDAGQYELFHDYLAEKFHDISGIELDPFDRDNILYFWDEYHKKDIESKIDYYDKNMTERGKIVFSDYFMIFIFFSLLFRLFSPLYNSYLNIFNQFLYYPENGSIIDINFIPIFVSHLAWQIYVTLFYRRFFSLLSYGKILSKTTVISSSLCVVVAIFIPYVFVLSIGIGGFVVGIKLLQIAKNNKTVYASYKFFSNIAKQTIGNVTVVIIVGIFFFIYINSFSITKSSLTDIYIFMYFISIVLTYFMLAVRNEHITKSASSKMLALNNRGRV